MVHCGSRLVSINKFLSVDPQIYNVLCPEWKSQLKSGRTQNGVVVFEVHQGLELKLFENWRCSRKPRIRSTNINNTNTKHQIYTWLNLHFECNSTSRWVCCNHWRAKNHKTIWNRMNLSCMPKDNWFVFLLRQNKNDHINWDENKWGRRIY